MVHYHARKDNVKKQYSDFSSVFLFQFQPFENKLIPLCRKRTFLTLQFLIAEEGLENIDKIIFACVIKQTTNFNSKAEIMNEKQL